MAKFVNGFVTNFSYNYKTDKFCSYQMKQKSSGNTSCGEIIN